MSIFENLGFIQQTFAKIPCLFPSVETQSWIYNEFYIALSRFSDAFQIHVLIFERLPHRILLIQTRALPRANTYQLTSIGARKSVSKKWKVIFLKWTCLFLKRSFVKLSKISPLITSLTINVERRFSVLNL